MNENPLCGQCKHYYVTWDRKAPRGCHGHGFKTNQTPAQVVQQTSGLPCQLFQLKADQKRD